ncbi:carboxypeptidase-like regulatory domain-containing protein [Flavobacterium sp. ASW18X]|uniref:carboxypeptidase-like regulatory domain-containing protein n=1 Tax=Flavobacterium sp. ASW18X TaxID=2572595 RepID=UPI0010AE61F4|nr:carboxypeptidase-like regulatory domain-containing protein [Flavobacterium sp. ASW18X]TKD65274.1 TonB-dependent receptor [Flavobacterium sp. ASW18X]
MPVQRVLLALLFCCYFGHTQEQKIYGKIVTPQQSLPIANASIRIENTELSTNSDVNGTFSLAIPPMENYIISISKNGYEPLRLPFTVGTKPLDLGTLFLLKDVQEEITTNLISLTDSELENGEEQIDSNQGLLQATKDIFLRRAAFDFGQAFFRVKGYDSNQSIVLFNGMPMNRAFDGRPQWNTWGGLNDATRNQSYTNNLAQNNLTFGGPLGTTSINTRPSALRQGSRVTTSFSNRTYSSRLMATHVGSFSDDKFSFGLSGSGRWAKEGYLDGTLYNAYSFFGALEYKPNIEHSYLATFIAAKNKRGRSAALTPEVNNLTSRTYNPYWGLQNGKIRNSRERDIFEPFIQLNHFYSGKKVSLTSGFFYQNGYHKRSRLAYFNAPNPDPTYYRYLPSFYINNRIGADFSNADLARSGFLAQPQLNWNQIYLANKSSTQNGKAAYVLLNDVQDENILGISTTANITLAPQLKLDFGANFFQHSLQNYAQLKDLLGADYHLDIDPFSNTSNNTLSTPEVKENAVFGYHYKTRVNNLSGFMQLSYSFSKWSAFVSGKLEQKTYQRTGFFKNERYLNNSQGDGKKVNFTTYGLKGGLAYQINGRHLLEAQGLLSTKAPTLQNTYINPRENHLIVPNITSEKITSINLNYQLRLPDVTGRLSTYYTRFQNGTDINYFYVDAGVGSDFVQETITQLDRLHKGIELGFTFTLSPQVKLTTAANFGNYTFANNPNVTINFDTAGAEEELINLEGNLDLGKAQLQGLRLAQGPQTALSIGLDYRDPKYWWIGASANYLSENYIQPSTILRTRSFLLNPDTNLPFADATPEKVETLLKQQPLPSFYLLNLIGGKSWLIKDWYISAFVSINNVFDVAYSTGGYEQSRNGNFRQLQEDNLRDNPSFAPKYWQGFGRTYFLNLSFSY